MGPTPEFLERQGDVRFVQGDLHDPGVAEPHDVVWCSGVLYHAPHPLLTLERLHALTTETLLLATETIQAAAAARSSPPIPARTRPTPSPSTPPRATATGGGA